jgi:cobalt-zinc-cadmium efflux system outer membrane protein
VALGRARSELAAAQAARATAIGDLAALIGAGPDDVIQLTGDIRPAPITLDALRASVAGRADIRAHEAESRVARAEGKLAKANGHPDLGLAFAYELDTDDSIILGGLVVTLPFWNRAQGEKATARAKLRNAELERAALLAAASREVIDAFEAYMRARDAVDVFESDALPALADSEQLLQRSVDTGVIAVNDYILAYLEIRAARREYLARQRQLAKAAEAARFVAGMQP